ncbi:MAG: Fic family protein, partial [Acidobacteria bacterium]|nr:Fic family protein [Acidobacteriota bacterium]
MMRTTGRYVGLTSDGLAKAFIPAALPPTPPLEVDEHLRDQLDAALLALGRLDSISSMLPNPELFLYSYVRKEALVSSQIEGTQSSLSDLL